MEDIDTYIGLWLRDVPYVWFQNKRAKSSTILNGYTRKYLLPRFMYYMFLQPVEGKHTSLDSEYTMSFSKSSSCSIEQLRMFMVYDDGNVNGFGMKKHSTIPYEIRVNGRKVYLPRYLIHSSSATVLNVYDILGLNPPSDEELDSWQTTILVNLSQSQPPTMFTPITLPKIADVKDDEYKEIKSMRQLCRRQLDKILNETRNEYAPCISTSAGKGYNSFAVISDIDNHKVFIHPTSLLNSLKSCKYSKTILIPVMWNIIDSTSQHMSLIIVASSTIYLFDPWGDSFYESLDIGRAVTDILRKADIQRGNMIYLGYKGWAPDLSFLTLETMEEKANTFPNSFERGLSVVWVLWMIETILLNPNVPIAKIPRLAIQSILDDGGSFRKTALGYAEKIKSL